MAESDVSVLASTDRCSGEMEERMGTTSDSAIADEHSEYVTAFEGEMLSNSYTTSAEQRREYGVWLEQVQRQCLSEEEFVTASSKPNWTEVAPMSSSLAEGSSSCMTPVEKREIVARNQRFFQGIIKNQAPRQWKNWMDSKVEFLRIFRSSGFFVDFGDRLDVGKKIAEGGQAEIYEALFDGKIIICDCDADRQLYVLKVFKFEQSEWFRHAWAKGSECIYMQLRVAGWNCVAFACTLLKDGRFAFLMPRFWGDLRKAINVQKLKDKTHLMPPFPPAVSTYIIYKIARGMRSLHRKGILHRDLKADNVFVYPDIEKVMNENQNRIGVWVGDFESSEGVMGTRFWRAPEVLGILRSSSKDKFSDPTIWTEKVDVYAYAMTCYEVLSGCIPFQKRAANDYNIGDKRPTFPDYVDPEIQELLRKCWNSKPLMRPNFKIICNELEQFIVKKVVCCEALAEDESDVDVTWWLRLVSTCLNF